jgi:two-component sensor histidine kinase
MKQDNLHNFDLKEPKNQKALTSFLDVIHSFSRGIVSSYTEEDVFDTFISEIPKRLNLVDCVIYKVNSLEGTLIQVAGYDYKSDENKIIQNRLRLKFGEGLAGRVARDGNSILASDISKEKDYVKDIISAGSEIEVPIKINNEVYAVISSEHPEVGFYNEYHVKLFEILASITVGALIKIQEKNDLEKVKNRLESILEKKSSDLDRAIDALSTQYSELKYQHDKRELLLQEVHHRVNNNLQIISSILKLYLTESDEDSKSDLKEIHNRVQAMALIHQNIYKSLELNLVDIECYVRDLMNHMKSLNDNIYISFDQEINYKHINLNTLVPLGLYLTELVNTWVQQVDELTSSKEIHFQIKLKECNNDKYYELRIQDNVSTNLFENFNLDEDTNIHSILITALMEQLEGSIEIEYIDDYNSIKLCFDAI